VVVGALLSVACGPSAAATNEAPSVTIRQETSTPKVAATTVAAPSAEPTKAATPSATGGSVKDANALAASIAKEATSRMFAETSWSKSKASDRPTAKGIWLEGSALEWKGEVVLWFHVQSVYDENFVYKIAKYDEFISTGTSLVTRSTYERRKEAPFSKVYVSFTMEGVNTMHYFFDRTSLEGAKGNEIQNPLLSQAFDNAAKGPPPWILGAK